MSDVGQTVPDNQRPLDSMCWNLVVGYWFELRSTCDPRFPRARNHQEFRKLLSLQVLNGVKNTFLNHFVSSPGKTREGFRATG